MTMKVAPNVVSHMVLLSYQFESFLRASIRENKELNVINDEGLVVPVEPNQDFS